MYSLDQLKYIIINAFIKDINNDIRDKHGKIKQLKITKSS